LCANIGDIFYLYTSRYEMTEMKKTMDYCSDQLRSSHSGGCEQNPTAKPTLLAGKMQDARRAILDDQTMKPSYLY